MAIGQYGAPLAPNYHAYMVRRICIAAAQVNCRVGDINHNVRLIKHAISEARDLGAEMVVFPELTICGYPPEDLLLKPGFLADNRRALSEVADFTQDITAVVGFADFADDLYNGAAVLSNGSVLSIYRKQILPNYGVFDEARYFHPGVQGTIVTVGDVRIGISICEDIWAPHGPIVSYAAYGADLVVNINASPYSAGKRKMRETMLSTRAADNSVAILYVNLVGGQDELVFDGASVLVDHNGNVAERGGVFTEEIRVFDIQIPERFRKRLVDPRGSWINGPERAGDIELVEVSQPEKSQEGTHQAVLDLRPPPISGATTLPIDGFDSHEVYQALVVGTRDYVEKNGFSSVLVALSGGVDSALVAVIAVDALGPERVRAIGLPSRYSSKGSIEDAAQLAKNLDIVFEVVPIENVHGGYESMISEWVSAAGFSLADENLQSRIRGTYMMARSNLSGAIVLTTSNKSELAVGYSTLYGDTAGGFAVIKDVLKTQVYELCRYRNSVGEIELIPREILTKAPSAELRPDQRDDQSLPPYEVLDPLLVQLIDLDQPVAEVVSNLPSSEIGRIARLIDTAEYKRRQGAPGVKVSARAFGKDRRMPITNGYRG